MKLLTLLIIASVGFMAISPSLMANGPVSTTSYAYVLGEAGGPSQTVTSAGTSSAVSYNYQYENYQTGSTTAAVSTRYIGGTYESTPDLHAQASASRSSAGLGFGATATATFTDNLEFINYANGNRATSDIVLYFTVDGSLSGGGSGTLDVSFGDYQETFNLFGGVQSFDATFESADLDENGNMLEGPLTISLAVAADTYSGLSSVADFSNTVKLGEVDVLDASGNPIQTQIYDTYDDGTHGPIDFPANTNLLVPEPSTWVLLGVGIAGALGRRAFRRSEG